MWVEITQGEYERAGLRCASDMTDGACVLIELLLSSYRTALIFKTIRMSPSDSGGDVHALISLPLMADKRTGARWRPSGTRLLSPRHEHRPQVRHSALTPPPA